MKRRTKIAAITAVCLVAVGTTAAFAGPVIYRDFFAPPPADVPTLTIDDSDLGGATDGGAGESSGGDAATSADPADFSGDWVIADGSQAGYRVDEVLNGTDVTVTGRTSDVSGTVTVDGLTVTAATIEIDVASIATDSGSRDAYFRDQALRVSEHPTAVFELAESITADNAPEPGVPVEHEITGDLTIAGVTQSVDFSAQLRLDDGAVRIAGQVPIVFADYGVQAPSLGFVKVESEGFVEFDLVFQQP